VTFEIDMDRCSKTRFDPEGAAAITPPALAARCSCANLGWRLFTGLLLAGAALPALAAIPECRRSRAVQLVPADWVEPASGCLRRVNTILHKGSNAVLPQSCTAYAPMPRSFLTRRKHIHRTLAESLAGSGRQSPRRPVRPGARLQPARGGAL